MQNATNLQTQKKQQQIIGAPATFFKKNIAFLLKQQKRNKPVFNKLPPLPLYYALYWQ